MYCALRALHIFTRAGVDADFLALIDKERDFDLRASLQRCRLCRVGCGVALEARVGLDNFQLDKLEVIQ